VNIDEIYDFNPTNQSFNEREDRDNIKDEKVNF